VKIRTLLSGGTAVVVGLAISVTVAPVVHADNVTPGSFNTVKSHRILDTRSGIGAPKAPVGSGETLTFNATADITGPVAAVVLNVTAVAPTAPGHLTVYAGGTAKPYASNLNFQAGEDVPNLVITPVAANGDVSITNGSAGTVNMLADIHGYYLGRGTATEPGTFVSMPSRRFLDTRKGIGAPKARIPKRTGLTLKVAGVGGIPADASAVVANLTAAQGTGRGYVTAYEGEPRPLASNLNYEIKEDRANLALVAIAADGTISLFNGGSVGNVDLVVDITGYFIGGTPVVDGSFVPSTPFRIYDSREGGKPAGALTTSKILTPGFGDPFFKAVLVNVTAVQPQEPGYLTTFDGVGPGIPSVSSSNFRPKHDVAGAVVLPVNPDGTISIYNGSYGNVDLVVDIAGFYIAPPVATLARMGAATPSTDQRIGQALAALKQFSKSPHSTPVSVTTTK